MAFNGRLAREIGLTVAETALLRRLSSPEKIQDHLSAMPSNPEPDGATCRSVRVALRCNVCHCIEAAFIAAAAMMLHGQQALLMDFQAKGDDDHVVTLVKHAGHWGAISKSNSLWMRWRDPVYRTPRELAMSYFHEYAKGTNKTLRRISKPFNIAAYRAEDWITAEGHCWNIAGELDAAPHVALISGIQAKRLRDREGIEVSAGRLKQFSPPI